MLRRVAAVTMVRNGGEMLRRWVDYYGGQLGKDNIFVFFDGQDQVPPPFTEGCQVHVLPRTDGNVAEADRARAALLSAVASELLGRYDFVIGTDIDEFIVPDPAKWISLPEYLSGIDTDGCVAFSPLGCDVVQNVECEAALDSSRPVLAQRSFALLSTRYTKASILCAATAGNGSAKPQWGSGFHRVRGANLHILKDLYLFHFGCANAPDVLARQSDADLGSRGWSRHLRKRGRLFKLVSRLPVRSWNTWVPRARRLQSFLRPPYAWNKPAMLGLRILVRIPERFSRIV